MIFILKFSLYFIISFLILSINVKNESLFIHLTKISNPYTGFILDNSFKISKKTKNNLEAIFTNTIPNKNDINTGSN